MRLAVIGKLKTGVTRDAAQADMERVTRGIAEREPRNMEGRGVNVRPYREVMLGDFRTPLYVLVASVTFVLLIGCVNVANLLLARATTRRREIAIRAAIGGGRWRIVRQLLTESIVLALVGGSAGVGIAYVGIRLFVTFGPRNVPRLAGCGTAAGSIALRARHHAGDRSRVRPRSGVACGAREPLDDAASGRKDLASSRTRSAPRRARRRRDRRGGRAAGRRRTVPSQRVASAAGAAWLRHERRVDGAAGAAARAIRQRRRCRGDVSADPRRGTRGSGDAARRRVLLHSPDGRRT